MFPNDKPNPPVYKLLSYRERESCDPLSLALNCGLIAQRNCEHRVWLRKAICFLKPTDLPKAIQNPMPARVLIPAEAQIDYFPSFSCGKVSVKGGRTLSESKLLRRTDTNGLSGADEQILSQRTYPSATASCSPFSLRAMTPEKVLELQFPSPDNSTVGAENDILDFSGRESCK